MQAAAAAAAAPWWTTRAASEASAAAAADGTALVTEGANENPSANGSVTSAEGASLDEHAGQRLPPLPSQPLPAITALVSRAPPSEARWHCASLLAGYAAAWRLYGGCMLDDPLGAATAVCAAAPVCMPGGAQPRSAACAAEAAVAAVVAQQSGAGARRSAAAEAGRLAVADAAALCGLGRAIAVRALVDLAELFAAAAAEPAEAELAHRSDGAGSGGTPARALHAAGKGRASTSHGNGAAHRKMREALLASKKARFFASWANESADLLAAVAGELRLWLAQTAADAEGAASALARAGVGGGGTAMGAAGLSGGEELRLPRSD